MLDVAKNIKNLKNVNKLFVSVYLHYDDKKIDSSWVYISGLSSIGLMVLGWYLGEEKLISGIVIGVISALILAVCLFFKIRVTPDKKRLYFFYGINMCFVPLATCYTSCVFLKDTIIGWIIPLVVYAILMPIIAVTTINSEAKAIADNKYANELYKGPNKTIIYAGSSMAAILSMVGAFDHNYNLVFGGLFGLIGLIMGTNPYFFLKSYCYHLLEKENEE